MSDNNANKYNYECRRVKTVKSHRRPIDTVQGWEETPVD